MIFSFLAHSVKDVLFSNFLSFPSPAFSLCFQSSSSLCFTLIPWLSFTNGSLAVVHHRNFYFSRLLSILSLLTHIPPHSYSIFLYRIYLVYIYPFRSSLSSPSFLPYILHSLFSAHTICVFSFHLTPIRSILEHGGDATWGPLLWHLMLLFFSFSFFFSLFFFLSFFSFFFCHSTNVIHSHSSARERFSYFSPLFSDFCKRVCPSI